MSEITGITKIQFIDASNKYPQSKWVKFGFKCLSKTILSDSEKIKNNIIYAILAILMLGSLINIINSILVIPCIIYNVTLFGLSSYVLSIIILNYLRIKKICGELDIDKDEYDNLVILYAS